MATPTLAELTARVKDLETRLADLAVVVSQHIRGGPMSVEAK